MGRRGKNLKRKKFEVAKEERCCFFLILFQNEEQGLQLTQEGRVTCALLLGQREHIQVTGI